MRKVIRRRIRHTEDGLDLAVDFNADVAINVGRPRPDDAAPAEESQSVDDRAREEQSDEERNER